MIDTCSSSRRWQARGHGLCANSHFPYNAAQVQDVMLQLKRRDFLKGTGAVGTGVLVNGST